MQCRHSVNSPRNIDTLTNTELIPSIETIHMLDLTLSEPATISILLITLFSAPTSRQ